MDFTSRGAQPQTAFPDSSGASGASNKHAGKRSRNIGSSTGVKVVLYTFLVAAVILVVAAIGLLVFGPVKESQYVRTDKYQAVFLTNGQVYFGHIKKINSQFLDLQNIYYLQQAQKTSSNASSNITLIKLGCELHAPYDEMVIQASQVSFWENIQDSGQVGKAIKQLKACTPPASQSSNAGVPGASSPTSGSASNASNGSSAKP